MGREVLPGREGVPEEGTEGGQGLAQATHPTAHFQRQESFHDIINPVEKSQQ